MSKFGDLANQIAIVVTGVTGLMMLLGYYLDVPIINTCESQLLVWVTIIAAFLLIVGLIGLSRRHLKIVLNKSEEVTPRILSTYFLCLLFGMIAIGMLSGTKNPTYSWIFGNMFSIINQSTAALPAFYLFTAAFRSFTAKTKETVLFLLAGVFILIRNAPIGPIIWSGFLVVGDWILDVPMTAMMRALTITAGIGIIAYATRTMIGGK